MTGDRRRVLVAAVIVAAGRGRRLGEETAKQYLPLAGPCALRRSVELFLGLPRIGALQAVILEDDRTLCAVALAGIADLRLLPPVAGGETRALSVRLGLEALAPLAPERVLIHDAARPFTPPAVVAAVLDALDAAPGALAALPVVDALWRGAGGSAGTLVPRDGLWRAQTPQGFHFAPILAAHRRGSRDAADDVAVPAPPASRSASSRARRRASRSPPPPTSPAPAPRRSAPAAADPPPATTVTPAAAPRPSAAAPLRRRLSPWRHGSPAPREVGCARRGTGVGQRREDGGAGAARR